MLKYQLGKGVDLDFGATQPVTVFDFSPTGVGQPNGAPLPIQFQAGASALLVMEAAGWAQAEQDAVSMAFQGSESETTGFATLTDVDGNNCVVGGAAGSPLAIYEIVIPLFGRLRNLSASAGDGYGSAYLLTN